MLFIYSLLAITLFKQAYGAASCSERDQAFCTSNKRNCERSRYVQTVCPLTCGKCSAPRETVCLTGPPGSDICSTTVACPITHHCYFGSCCPLPICNDGVTKAKQICGVQNVCPRGYSCQNSGCCPTGQSATRLPVSGQRVAQVNHRGQESALTSGVWGKCYLASQRSASNSFTPRCSPMGHYRVKQCVGTQCFCVNPEDGTRISGMGVPDCSNKGCALKLADALESARSRSLVNPNTPVCNREGLYEVKQCNPLSCWCVDTNTGRKIEGSDRQRSEGQPRCS